MRIARLAATRSTCLRRQVGAVIVKDKRVLATGYNGAPSGLAHCLDIGCLREQNGIPSGQRHELCRAIQLVYASTYSADSKAYIESTPNRLEEERMGVIIQQIAGRRRLPPLLMI